MSENDIASTFLEVFPFESFKLSLYGPPTDTFPWQL